MNLISNDNLKNNLAKIKAELALYDEFTRIELFNQCINQRLIHTLELYNVKTDQLSDFLLGQHGIRVLKAITKLQKFSDRKVIYENMKGESDV